MAFAENTLLQKTMVRGLEIVNTKQLVKLRKGVHATDPACSGPLINTSPLYKIISPNKNSMMELMIPNIFSKPKKKIL